MSEAYGKSNRNEFAEFTCQGFKRFGHGIKYQNLFVTNVRSVEGIHEIVFETVHKSVNTR